MDTIHIKDLLVRFIIGVTPEERRDKQDVLINIVLWADLREAGRTDDLADTIDYHVLKKRILAMMETTKFRLVEALADRIASICLEDPRAQRVSVRVEKPGALRFARSVGVEVLRERG